MESVIKQFFEESARIKIALAHDEAFRRELAETAKRLIGVIKGGGTIYSCGNGGSSCDSMHLTEELTARYKRERKGIRAMHFMDTAALTCWSNDYSYETVFKRFAETFCTDKDALIGLSTSGNSQNVIDAVAAAKERNCLTIGLLGKGGGRMASLCDISLLIPSDETDRIQESHITIIHALIELIETNL